MPALLPYLDLRGMALDDLVLTEHEMHELKDEAVRLGLGSNQFGLAHGLAYASLATGVELGNLMAERQLFRVLAPRLGINEQVELTRSDQRNSEMMPTVCFTGDIFISGSFVKREGLEELALAAGWRVEPTVTKKRCTLLVGDRNSQSLKMQKARQYGIEIASGDQFAALIGLSSLPPDGKVLPRDE